MRKQTDIVFFLHLRYDAICEKLPQREPGGADEEFAYAVFDGKNAGLYWYGRVL